jgi:hypothetical protein
VRRIHIVTVGLVISGALIFAYSQTLQRVSRPGQIATEAQRDHAVARKMLVKELPKGLKGLELRDGVFLIKPGYKFVKKTYKTILVAPKSGSRGAYFTCTCIDPLHGSRKPAGGCVVLTNSRFA